MRLVKPCVSVNAMAELMVYHVEPLSEDQIRELVRKTARPVERVSELLD
jgi:hypothetical protein